ncbi:MAG: cyclic nucleotide-binding protein [Flavobacteriaceae bacterium]|nr:MAG: cyclic nucleotide-binding protein [Flavobacteriaceae bacterium]
MKSFLSEIYKVDDQVLNEYLSHWSEYSAPKKTILTEAGKTERYVYFVKEGIQKSYYLNEGKQHIMFFAYGTSFSGIMESFLNQTPSNYYLETITNSTFLRLSYEKHMQFIQEHRALETLYRKVAEQFLLGIIERHHQLMAFNTVTRFKSFVKRSPHLLNMVPHKDIASYLRIDPTNFSKFINTIRI